MAGKPRPTPGGHGKSLTRTAGEWIGGIVRVGFFLGVAGLVLAELITFPVNGIRNRFHYAHTIPHIGQGVPIGFAAVVGLTAAAVYGIAMRPKLAVDRVSGRDGAPQVGGRVWTGAGPSDAGGAPGRHSADVTP